MENLCIYAYFFTKVEFRQKDDIAAVINYHKSPDGMWRRCRAVKRAGGGGVTGCLTAPNVAHAIGRQGVADRGGGVIIEQRANGYPMVTTITPGTESYWFTATSATGKVRYYFVDGRIMTRQERKWLAEGELWRKAKIPASPLKQYRRRLHQESLVRRTFQDFKTYDFGVKKQNEERDVFVKWFEQTDHFGTPLERMEFRLGDDNNQKHKEPDIIIHHPDYKNPIGVELVKVYPAWEKGVTLARANPKAPIQTFVDSDYKTLLDNTKRMLDQKCSKKYVTEDLHALILLTENQTEFPVPERLARDTKRDSRLFDEAWMLSELPQGKLAIRLGVNMDRKPLLTERNENAV